MDRDSVYLADIYVACREIASFLGKRSKDEFLADNQLSSAVVRQLEIVGEVTKRLSTAFRSAHPELPWKDMAGLRDVLIHQYDEVDLDLVWDIATVKAPEVGEIIAKLLPPPK
ncbi:MAG: DUF86 domain-containing protein [Planctomycetes bacterium]|nr:DUF86 domain-containing protein [Planctomycetota bacterium]MBI3833753.1 DUF86 domain-containing protein [Planctomycetota bacterium]